MKQVFRKILSFFLLAVFLVAADPGHLIHQLANHEDTIDGHNKTSVLSVHHIHCESSQFSLSPFLELQVPILEKPVSIATELLFENKIFVGKDCPVRAIGRAPPALT